MPSRSVPLPVRLYQTTAMHRAVPTPLAKRLVRARAQRSWTRDPMRRQQALLQMQFLLGKSSRAGEIEQLGARYVFEAHKRSELRWRPWLTTHQHIDGLPLLREAVDAGRGVLLNPLHHGQLDGAVASLGHAGIQLTTASGRVYLDPNGTAYHRQHHKNSMSAGAASIPAKGSYRQICRLLGEGGVVLLASDLPGDTEVEFLGRRIGVASGAVRLACETGAALVPLAVQPAGWKQRVQVLPPVLPPASGDVAAFAQELFRSHEPAVLAWPEGYDSPLRHFRPVDAADRARFGLSEAEVDLLRL